MALPTGLNDLAKLSLLASDTSYFDLAHPAPIALGSLDDTSYGQRTALYSVPVGFTKAIEFNDTTTTGFGFIAYIKTGVTPAETEVIIALRGTDGPNSTDWVANSQSLGWNQWNQQGRAQVFSFLDSLKLNPTDPDSAFEGTIHFTGQSLGGGLAQYAAYEYVQSHQGLTGFSKANITLTTFNGFGGVLGLQQNLGNYDSTILSDIGSNAHFYTEGDLVSRLGNLNGVGHTGGTAYMLKAYATEIDPDTGEPFLLGPIDAHRIETGFYPFLLPGVEFEAAEVRPIEYLPMQHVQELAALYGRVLNDQDVSPLESGPRLVAGVIAGLTLGRPEEMNALVQAVFKHLHAAGKIEDEWYAFLRRYDWGEIAGSPFLIVPGAGLYGLSLLAAVLSDALEVQVDRQVQLFNTIREWVSHSVPTVSQGVSPEDRRIQTEMMLALVPGVAIGSELGDILQPLNLDINQFAQTLTTTGDNWLREALNMIRERAHTLDHNLATLSARLTSAITDIAVDIGAGPAIVENSVDTVLIPFMRDTAQGIGNAVTEFVQDVAGAFDLGRALNLADIQLIDHAYAAELNDPRLSSSARAAIEEAQAIVQQAAQTVVIQTGVGPNPFHTPGYVPGEASTATVEERLGEVFRLSLPFAAGTAGQRVLLHLQGSQANQLSVATDEGAQVIGADGTFHVTVPEGADQARFTLIASDNVSADATVTLSATLVDPNGAATHTTQMESLVSVRAFVGTGPDGYEEWTEDFSDVPLENYPPEGLPIGAGGFLHQTLIGGPGPEAINHWQGFGDDILYGNGGDDWISGGYGHDLLYGGDGNDRLLADPYDYHPDPIPRPSPLLPLPTLDGKDYADGGEGNDRIGGGGNADRLIGGAGDDEIWGDALTRGTEIEHPDGSRTFVSLTGVLFPGDDVLEGGDGNDYLSGDGGDDFLDGGPGDDLLIGDTQQGVALLTPMASGDDYLVGGEGNDELQGNAGHDVLLGGGGNDRLFGDDPGVDPSLEGDDWLDGGDGEDILTGLGGDDTLVGGEGSDVLLGGIGADRLIGGSGDDIGFGGDGNDDIIAGAGDDQFDGEAGDDVLFGDEGNDLLIGGDGVDELDGGADDDLLIGGADDDALFGRDGNDELQGNEGNDLLVGDAGDDRIFGQEGDDELFGGDGPDALRGDEGDDLLDGGAGDDILVGDADGQIGGSGGNDVLSGGAGNDRLIGGGGQDTYLFERGGGVDTIVEAIGEGNRLIFGPGISPNGIIAAVGPNDSLVIRTGFGGDEVQIWNFGTSTIDGPHAIDSFEFSDGTILTYGQLSSAGLARSGGGGHDHLVGTAQDDRIYGGEGNDVIQGQDGADALLGENGEDVLLGGTGNDMLSGGASRDVLDGGEGDDVLNGGAEGDALEGGPGRDLLVGGTGDDHLNGGEGNDVYRFNIGDGLDSLFDSGSSDDTDTVAFGSGITSGSVSLSSQFGQIIIKVGTGSDGILSGSTFDIFGSQTIEQFQFADGSALAYADLVARGFNIVGTEFDDALFGTDLNDRFHGGRGNDRLEGGGGNDSYFFDIGDGTDKIVDAASAGAGNEVIFGSGIMASDLRLDLVPNESNLTFSNLLLRVGTNGDAIQLDLFDQTNLSGPHIVETFRFADSSALTYEQLLAYGFDLSGTEGDDHIEGTEVVDRIKGAGGSDVLRGGMGDDQLDGGAGNDRLMGGQGNDTYLFAPGSGRDTIVEVQGSQDVIRMTAGVAPSDVVVTRQNNDLVLSLNGGADQLTVSLYFLASSLQIEQIQFDDETVWDAAAIQDRLRPTITGTVDDDTLVGTAEDDRLLGLNGEDQLAGLAGNDELDGGSGADHLIGGSGDDQYMVDDPGDSITELTNEGIDTVRSSVTYTLGSHLEHLTLTGALAINGIGNELDNVLTGNSGANVLNGGPGNDTYIVDSVDTVVEAADEGVDTVHTGSNSTLGPNVENLSLTGSASLRGNGNNLDNVLQADGSISVLAGGDGDDTYVIGANGDEDILVEAANGGIDAVIAARDYRLPANIENLTLLDPRVPDFGSFSLIPYRSSEQFVTGYGNHLANILVGGRANNVLDGGGGADTMFGDAGDDVYIVDDIRDLVIEQSDEGIDRVQSIVSYSLSEHVENLTLMGTASINGTGNALDNTVRGNEAVNVLDGGAGNDALSGLGGADVYLFGRGSGRDTVFDSGTADEIDTIQFDSTVTVEDVEAYRNGFNLELAISGTTDELTLLSFFGAAGYEQKQVKFSDGTMWSSAELSVWAIVGTTVTGTLESETISGSDGHDLLIGSAGNDVLMGGGGKDTLYGDNTFQSLFGPQVIGDDTLIGGAGNDSLFDFRGNNLFDGGAGDDTLVLGTGIDTVLFGRGSGVDRVSLDNGRNDIDVIQMAADIAPADVVLSWQSPSVADVLIPDSGDQLTVQLSTDWFAVGPETTQAIVRFADGTEWSLAWSSSNVGVPAATSGDDMLSASFPATLAGLAGDDAYLIGSSGVAGTYAVIEAEGDGIDTVQSHFNYVLDPHVENLILAESASSVLSNAEFGTGNDLDNLLVGNSGDNILDGGAGNDVLVGGVFRSIEDFFVLGTGSDILIGGAGDDVLMADGGDIVFALDGGNGSWLFLDGGAEFREGVPRLADDLFIGGTGNDTYIVHSQQQTIAEFENEGIDTVRTTVSYMLGDHLENLVLVSPPEVFDDEDNVIPPLPLDGIGNDLDNVLMGSEDANVLSGLAGRDTLTGSGGSDILRGGLGHDTYLFNIGDGMDGIEDVASIGEGNRIQFGVGIMRDNLRLSHDEGGRTLTIQVGSIEADQLVLTNFDPSGANGSLVAETLAFADGSEVTLTSLLGPRITIYGTDHDDVAVGTAGDDGIDTGSGDDTVYGDAGNDFILAGPGVDSVTGDEGADRIFGGSGTDYLYGGEGDDVIDGEEGNDVVVGDAGNDILSGGAGNDVLNGGAGSDQLLGGDGDDTLYIDAEDTIINGGAGYDTVTVIGTDAIIFDAAAAEVEFVAGSGGNDVLTAAGSLIGVTFYGGDGDDHLTGGIGNDVLVGQAGADTLTGGFGNDVLNGADGEDILTGEGGNDTIYGGPGNDQISGGEGNDSISGDEGADIVFGGPGTDYLYGGEGEDVIEGEEGNDVVVGDAGNDILSGGEGNDILNGGMGTDQLYGGDGDDTLYIDAADISINGGAGYDVVSVVGSEAVIFDATTAEIEFVAGGSGNDTFTAVGSATNVTFYGGDGDDHLAGGDGNDVLVGQAGADTLTGGFGNDVLNGGDGDDHLSGELGNDTVYGGTGNDWVSGGDGDDSVSGEDGADTIFGGSGGDYLYGGDGDDVISGDDGNDTLVGQTGHDTLIGGVGNDYLVGGGGDDMYMFTRGDGADTISEDDTTVDNHDRLGFDPTIDPLDLILSRQANDLRVAIHGTSDQVAIENWYLGEAHQVETIQTGNGQALLNTQVDQLIHAMAAFTEQTGLTWDQAIDQRPQDVQAVLAASWQ